MKIRTGFVSNSSTSSFLIYGISVESEDIQLAYERIIGKTVDDEDFSKTDLVYEILKKLNVKDFSVECPYYDDVVVGISPSEIKDDETGKQFKERVEKVLKQIFGDQIKCDYYEEAWRDG